LVRSVGCSLNFEIEKREARSEKRDNLKSHSAAVSDLTAQRSELTIDVFTTRPDTVYGVSFMVLAPEHPFVDEITTTEYTEAVAGYKKQASLKSERDRQADVKNISGTVSLARMRFIHLVGSKCLSGSEIMYSLLMVTERCNGCSMW
jgi:leucyl-tRNA synthetase